MTGGSPVFIGTFAMTYVVNGTYVYNFEEAFGHSYLANVMVYTDGTFTAPNPLYTPGDIETISTSGGNSPTPGSGGCPLIGYVLPAPVLIGYVKC